MTCAYQLDNIRFRYGEKTALSLPALTVHAGTVTALIGPNGCGKSTLLHLLAFLEAPATGRIVFFGEPVKAIDPSLRKRIGFLPQKPYMLRGTVRDNLTLALKLQGLPKTLWPEKIHAALERLDILHLIDLQAKTLSGGELQKAALARALITGPDVLLLDEPFSYLDQASALRLEAFISSYIEETQGTLVFSTHNRLQGLALAQDVISLVQGELIRSPLINLYHGQAGKEHIFDTGKIRIMLPRDTPACRHVSIDPREIVLSRQPLVSSIRNRYHGRVVSISEEMGKVRVAVEAGEIFQVLITYEALQDLDLSLGDLVWIHFKSNSVVVF
ncbi:MULTISPECIES: ABC transporter ATP-binding protein [Methylobacter]|uniref:ABC transporter ATP-binding protein n=1 Tax=Methylobacter TaxID=429 RepID=UPI0003763DAF|nr:MULTISPECIES: ABC transporter ATP-binding protein [Methylobacter]